MWHCAVQVQLWEKEYKLVLELIKFLLAVLFIYSFVTSKAFVINSFPSVQRLCKSIFPLWQ